jgi:hypothetical protein
MSATPTTAPPDHAPVPRPALGPALNEQGCDVGRVEQNRWWITDGTCRPAFLTNPAGAVLPGVPPTTGNQAQRAAGGTDRDLLPENNRA